MNDLLHYYYANSIASNLNLINVDCTDLVRAILTGCDGAVYSKSV